MPFVAESCHNKENWSPGRPTDGRRFLDLLQQASELVIIRNASCADVSRELQRSLCSSTELEILTSSRLPRDAERLKFFWKIRPGTWPHMRHIYLRNMTVDYMVLSNVLDSTKETLESVFLRDVTIVGEDMRPDTQRRSQGTGKEEDFYGKWASWNKSFPGVLKSNRFPPHYYRWGECYCYCMKITRPHARVVTSQTWQLHGETIADEYSDYDTYDGDSDDGDGDSDDADGESDDDSDWSGYSCPELW